jgi:mono/diheme cytochrome c family protein
MSVPVGRRRRRMNDAVAEVGLVLAMLFLMFASAIAGFAVGRHTGGDDKTSVATTQTANETVTTSPDETTSADKTTAEQTTAAAGGGSEIAEGKRIFTSAGCIACHTLKAAGATGNVGPNLDEVKPSYDKAIERVTNGKPPMPSFRGQLSAKEIKAVARFVSSSTRGSS